MNFFLASTNPHKAEEFNILFRPEILKVLPAPKALEVEENGTTFMQNSFLKAEAYFKAFKSPVVADDSGLCVEALPEDLGVQTARYGGPNLTAKERYELLLRNMLNVPDEKRGAYFVCYLCFYLSSSEVFFFEGRVHGSIAHKAEGSSGFGYDPIFVPRDFKPGGKTLAEIPEWKDVHSHRAVACSLAQKFFQERVGQKG
ncbi:MAG: non-canonical purine NTP pyrophosphatase [Bacteriovoracaceae bacterium]